MEIRDKQEYFKPTAEMEETTVNATEAYSAAAVPAAAAAIEPVIYGGACIAAAVYAKNC